MNCVSLNNNILTLDTGMNESAFGKTNLAAFLNSDEGTFIDFSKDSANPEFSPWHFSQIHSNEKGNVVLSGTLPPNAGKMESLETLFAEEKNFQNAVFLAVSAISTALAENKNINPVGGGGILAGKDCLLFLPQFLFSSCLNSLSFKDRAELNGCYQYKGLSRENSLCFLRSVLAYRALSKKLPFIQEAEDKRQQDILDSYFLPVEFTVNGINPELAKSINEGLSPKVNFSSKSQKDFPLAGLKNELGIAPDGTLIEVIRKTALPEIEFLKLGESYFAKKTRKTRRNRFIFKNKLTLILCTAISLFAIYVIRGALNRCANLPTTQGLSSVQAIEQFYSAVHNLDTEKLMECGKGQQVKGVLNVVSAMYVTNKSREGYSNEKTVTPERWFCLPLPETASKAPWIYGLTQVVIDWGSENFHKADLHKEAPKRMEKLSPVTENGTLPAEGERKNFKVSYYRIFTHGEKALLTIEKNVDFVSANFVKGKWIVTDVETKVQQEEEIPEAELYEAFSAALKSTENDILKAVKILTEKYPWLPEADSIHKEKEQLLEDIKNFRF